MRLYRIIIPTSWAILLVKFIQHDVLTRPHVFKEYSQYCYIKMIMHAVQDHVNLNVDPAHS